MRFCQKGFTLIELLFVVSIIAILARIAVPNFFEAQVRSKTGRVRQEMALLSDALEAYALKTGYFPANQIANPRPSLEELSKNGWALQCLTTPVAYLPFVPQASFRYYSEKTITYSPYSPKPFFPYTYWRFDPKASAKGLVPQALLISAGPSDQLTSRFTATNLRLMPYDPTNGSTSAGDFYILFPADATLYERKGRTLTKPEVKGFPAIPRMGMPPGPPGGMMGIVK